MELVNTYQAGRLSLNVILTRFITFLFFFSVIFFPKVSGVDLAILLPVAICFLIITINSTLKIHKYLFFFLLLMLFVIIYQLIIINLVNGDDFQPLARLIRAFLQSLVICFFISSCVHANGNTFNYAEYIYVCLIIHAILILIGGVSSDFNAILSEISGNNKVKDFKASGLLAGFDIAGLVNVIGILYFIFFKVEQRITFPSFLALTVLMVSSLFTSRVSLLLCGLFFCYALYLIIRSRNSDLSLKLLSLVLLVFSFSAFVYVFLVLVSFTFNMDLVSMSADLRYDLTLVFAEDSFRVLQNMYFLPSDSIYLLFGQAEEVAGSDVGYIKNIFRVGLFGLILITISHVYFYILLKEKKQKNFVLLIVLILFALNFKNDYMYVRSIFPMLVCFSFYFFEIRNIND